MPTFRSIKQKVDELDELLTVNAPRIRPTAHKGRKKHRRSLTVVNESNEHSGELSASDYGNIQNP